MVGLLGQGPAQLGLSPQDGQGLDGAPEKPTSPVGKALASLGIEDFLSYGHFFFS